MVDEGTSNRRSQLDRKGCLKPERGKRMECKKSEPLPLEQDTINSSILELYESADESAWMDMYMTYRDLRERFEKFGASTIAQPWKCGDHLSGR